MSNAEEESREDDDERYLGRRAQRHGTWDSSLVCGTKDI